jgi:hypothetical protein
VVGTRLVMSIVALVSGMLMPAIPWLRFLNVGTPMSISTLPSTLNRLERVTPLIPAAAPPVGLKGLKFMLICDPLLLAAGEMGTLSSVARGSAMDLKSASAERKVQFNRSSRI